jgi:hypothetical protein
MPVNLQQCKLLSHSWRPDLSLQTIDITLDSRTDACLVSMFINVSLVQKLMLQSLFSLLILVQIRTVDMRRDPIVKLVVVREAHRLILSTVCRCN